MSEYQYMHSLPTSPHAERIETDQTEERAYATTPRLHQSKKTLTTFNHQKESLSDEEFDEYKPYTQGS